MIREFGYWKSKVVGLVTPEVPIVPYEPQRRELPARVLPIDSAWKGLESVVGDVIRRFDVGSRRCLEFGVEYGYSTVALSSFFDSVTGVDTFLGDQHTGNRRDIFIETSERLSPFRNIRLVRSDYRDWIAKDDQSYDLIHVDIVHTYIDTFHCGLWSARRAKCVMFHDTESFPAVKRALIDISRKTGKRFYNFVEYYGLGILT